MPEPPITRDGDIASAQYWRTNDPNAPHRTDGPYTVVIRKGRPESWPEPVAYQRWPDRCVTHEGFLRTEIEIA